MGIGGWMNEQGGSCNLYWQHPPNESNARILNSKRRSGITPVWSLVTPYTQAAQLSM